ncbi:MAG: hypothetical protein KAS66_16520 [Candidatus Omnitrophica bacterium]|nr:hypothetical protein [Candidatus Omnitrophota bacterium]
MKCEKCGTYNNEDRDVCRTCGASLTDSETTTPTETKTKKQNNVLKLGIILTILGICISLFMLSPTTHVMQESYNVKYQEPVYKTIEHNDPIYKDVFKTVVHNDPIYKDVFKTVTHNDPIYADTYKTISHSDPIYDTLYTYYIEGGYTIKNVYNVDTTYSGTDFWGNKEYTVVVYYYDALSKKSEIYYEKSEIRKTDTYEAIVGYDTWTEQVVDGQEIVDYDTWTEEVLDGQKITGYDTWTEQVPDGQEIIGYDTWSEQVLDGYTTKTKKEYRDKTVNCLMYEKISNLV